MNKYQEALDRLLKFEYGAYTIKIPFNLNLWTKDKTTLQKLVGRATPMNPIKIDSRCSCPKCQMIVYEYTTFNKDNYCSHCGQRLDWEIKDDQ